MPCGDLQNTPGISGQSVTHSLVATFLGAFSHYEDFPFHLYLGVLHQLAGWGLGIILLVNEYSGFPRNLSLLGTLQGALLIYLGFQSCMNHRGFSPLMLSAIAFRIPSRRQDVEA